MKWSFLFAVYSHSSVVSSTDSNSSQSASSVIHQEMFRLITINNRMNKTRLAHDNWIEGRTLLM